MMTASGNVIIGSTSSLLLTVFAEDWIGPLNYCRALLPQQLQLKTYKKSHVPTLFIVGNADPITSLEMICKSSEYVDNFTLKIVEGGGHFLPQEMPNYVNSLILDFLKCNTMSEVSSYVRI